MTRRVGILTGGGDAPGLNAVIRGFVLRAVGQMGWRVVGVEDSFNGLFAPRRLHELVPDAMRGLVAQGGTIIGTTNRGDPFAWPMDGQFVDRSQELADAMRAEEIEGLVCIGGDGTQAIAWRLMQTVGIPVIGVPKTIDNDLSATDSTFGFQTAVAVATDALDRLRTTAESHDRVMFLEVMGRDAGHIALHAGIAGGADVVLLPEIPYDPSRVAQAITIRRDAGKPYTIVVVAEGALPVNPSAAAMTPADRKQRLKRGGGAAAIAMANLDGRVDAEMRSCVLGHIQRGGSPEASDRVLATRYGVAAVDLVDQDRWGQMVALRNGVCRGVPIPDAISTYRLCDVDGEIMAAARAVGIEFGG